MNSPLRPEAGSRNLGHTFLANSVEGGRGGRHSWFPVRYLCRARHSAGCAAPVEIYRVCGSVSVAPPPSQPKSEPNGMGNGMKICARGPIHKEKFKLPKWLEFWLEILIGFF